MDYLTLLCFWFLFVLGFVLLSIDPWYICIYLWGTNARVVQGSVEIEGEEFTFLLLFMHVLGEHTFAVGFTSILFACKLHHCNLYSCICSAKWSHKNSGRHHMCNHGPSTCNHTSLHQPQNDTSHVCNQAGFLNNKLCANMSIHNVIFWSYNKSFNFVVNTPLLLLSCCWYFLDFFRLSCAPKQCFSC